MGKWLRGQLEHKLGRVLCSGMGVVLVGGGFATDKGEPFPSLALLFGTFLIAGGCLIDRIKEMWIGRGGAGIKTHDPSTSEETAAFARAVGAEGGLVAAPVPPSDLVDAARYQLADSAIQQLLSPSRTGPLYGCNFHIYMYDPDNDLLFPVFERESLEVAEGWRVGAGLVGLAYESGSIVWATQPEVSDSSFGLTPDQQERYADLAAVAAIPLYNANGVPFGVLSADTRESLSPLTADLGLTELSGLSEALARVFIDVLEWFNDS